MVLSSNSVRRALLGVAFVATVSLLASTGASASGYPSNLPHREYAATVNAKLSGGGTVGFYLSTNSHGQVVHAIVGATHLPSVVCPGHQPFYLDSNGESVILSNRGNELSGVSAAGTFTFKLSFDVTPYTMTVDGHLSARGNHVSGTVTVVSSTPGTLDGATGCTDPAPLSTFSTNLRWTKAG
jgi:hypothetical protein